MASPMMRAASLIIESSVKKTFTAIYVIKMAVKMVGVTVLMMRTAALTMRTAIFIIDSVTKKSFGPVYIIDRAVKTFRATILMVRMAVLIIGVAISRSIEATSIVGEGVLPVETPLPRPWGLSIN
jgi:hypothetical protein